MNIILTASLLTIAFVLVACTPAHHQLYEVTYDATGNPVLVTAN